MTEVESQQRKAARDYQVLEARYREILSENQLIKSELANFRRQLASSRPPEILVPKRGGVVDRVTTPLRTRKDTNEQVAMRRLTGYPYANYNRK